MNNISLRTLYWVVLLAVIMSACGGQTPAATQPAATAEPVQAATQPAATAKTHHG